MRQKKPDWTKIIAPLVLTALGALCICRSQAQGKVFHMTYKILINGDVAGAMDSLQNALMSAKCISADQPAITVTVESIIRCYDYVAGVEQAVEWQLN